MEANRAAPLSVHFRTVKNIKLNTGGERKKLLSLLIDYTVGDKFLLQIWRNVFVMSCNDHLLTQLPVNGH